MTDQTAEMVVLAYISGDEKLREFIEGTDKHLALVRPDRVPEGVNAEDCVVRLSFPDHIKNPEDRDKYLMTFASDGVIHATFTEDDLLRDEKGEIVHPRNDSHWSIVEISRGLPREVLNKKKDRGAGKVVNFCVDGDTNVLVRINGVVYWRKIKHLCHVRKFEVWDGVAWVPAAKAVCREYCHVLDYRGLRATPDHIVWTESHGPVTLLDACMGGYRLLGEEQLASRRSEGWKPPVLDGGDIPLEVYGRRTAIQEVNLFGWDAVASVLKGVHKTDTACPVKDIDLIAGVLRFILPRRKVYDIIDCGPRHRFLTDCGLVSNSSSYGGTAASIARKIEQDTGTKMEVEEVQGLLDAIGVRQPRATQWFSEQEELPKNSTVLKAASGRIRHLHTLGGGKNYGLSGRTLDGLVSSLGRECRNFPVQERVGSSASRACVNILDLVMRHPELKGYPGVCLYDSIVIFCPPEERAVWTKILQLYMSSGNGWAGPRGWILRLGVDTEFNAGWGTHPSQEMHDLYADPDYKPTPDVLGPMEDMVDELIAMFDADPELSVYNTWDIE